MIRDSVEKNLNHFLTENHGKIRKSNHPSGEGDSVFYNNMSHVDPRVGCMLLRRSIAGESVSTTSAVSGRPSADEKQPDG